MNELQAATAALTSVKTAYDIAKALLGLRDANAFREKALELNGAILDAQASASAAQLAQMALIQRVGALEEEVADLKAWDGEKDRYELKSCNPGVMVYALKSDAQPPEPLHLLCANCYQHRRKSMLQASPVLNMRYRVHSCAGCKTEYAFTPPSWNANQTEGPVVSA